MTKPRAKRLARVGYVATWSVFLLALASSAVRVDCGCSPGKLSVEACISRGQFTIAWGPWQFMANRGLGIRAADSPDLLSPLAFTPGSTVIGIPLWAPLLLVAAATIWLRHMARDVEGRCPCCNYDLSGLGANDHCPECGSTIPPIR